MAAAVASSNPHRSAITSTSSRIVPLRCSSSRARVSVNPACVASVAGTMKGAAVDRHASARGRQQQHQRYRSRDEEKPFPLVRRRRRGDEDARADASPDRKRSRTGSVSYHRDVRTGSSSSIRPSSSSATTAADVRRCDRDNACRAAKKNESQRDRVREDTTKQRARTGRPSATQRHQLAAAVPGRKPTPEEVEAAEVVRRLDIQRQREEARRKMDRMVKTVEFNDPFISPLDVFKPRAH